MSKKPNVYNLDITASDLRAYTKDETNLKISSNTGDLTLLRTSDKNNLVGAINTTWDSLVSHQSNENSEAHLAKNIKIEDATNLFTSTEVEGALVELFTSVSDGKGQIATAITDKGITTSSSDTFATIANKIGLIQTGTNTTDATATVSDILASKTAYVNGNKLTGTMANRGSIGTVTPSTTAKSYSAGYYNAFSVAGASTLLASNIKSGTSIFGVTGNYTGTGLRVFTTSVNITCPSFSGHSNTLSQQVLNCGFTPIYWIAEFTEITFNNNTAHLDASVYSLGTSATANTGTGSRDMAVTVSDAISGNYLYITPTIWQSLNGQFRCDYQTISLYIVALG